MEFYISATQTYSTAYKLDPKLEERCWLRFTLAWNQPSGTVQHSLEGRKNLCLVTIYGLSKFIFMWRWWMKFLLWLKKFKSDGSHHGCLYEFQERFRQATGMSTIWRCLAHIQGMRWSRGFSSIRRQVNLIQLFVCCMNPSLSFSSIY